MMKNVSSAELDFDAATITERFVRGDRSRKHRGQRPALPLPKALPNCRAAPLP